MRDYLNPGWVGRRVVSCPGCGQERWYGYGPCRNCGILHDRNANTLEDQ